MRHSPGLLCLLIGVHAAMAHASPAAVPATQPARDPIRVAIYSDTGASKRGPDDVTACLAKAGERFTVTRVTAEQIRGGALAEADVLVQGGGSGSGQANTLGPEGRQKIRAFVQGGGGYVGICAGAYLATTDYTWSLGILNAKVLDRKHWNRGSGEVDLAVTDAGRQRLGLTADVVRCLYYQGPLLAPDDKKDLPAYRPLASYASEIAKNGAPEGVMKGTTAVAETTFGKGRVIAISPHPERSEGLDGVIRRAIGWTAGREEAAAAAPATQPSPATAP